MEGFSLDFDGSILPLDAVTTVRRLVNFLRGGLHYALAAICHGDSVVTGEISRGQLLGLKKMVDVYYSLSKEPSIYNQGMTLRLRVNS